jgi:hypothetical protein
VEKEVVGISFGVENCRESEEHEEIGKRLVNPCLEIGLQ